MQPFVGEEPESFEDQTKVRFDVPLTCLDPHRVQIIYLVGAFRAKDIHARCWGWYDTPEEAVARMVEDKLFFEDGYDSHGLVEAYPYGSALLIEEATRWYRPVYSCGVRGDQESVEPCDPPESAKGIVGFLL